MCICVYICVEVRRQLVGVTSVLLPCGTQTVTVGCVYLHPLSSLVTEFLYWHTKIQTQALAMGNKIKT